MGRLFCVLVGVGAAHAYPVAVLSASDSPSRRDMWHRDLAAATRCECTPLASNAPIWRSLPPLPSVGAACARAARGGSCLPIFRSRSLIPRLRFAAAPPHPSILPASMRTCVSYLPDEDRLRCYRALELAHNVHDGQKRRDGSPFVTHPVAVAKLVASWGMDSECVMAALLHDSVEDTPLTFGEVETCFGPEVRTLVQGVTRVSKLDASKLQEIELELPMREIGLLGSPGGTATSRCGVEMRISSSAPGSSADVLLGLGVYICLQPKKRSPALGQPWPHIPTSRSTRDPPRHIKSRSPKAPERNHQSFVKRSHV